MRRLPTALVALALSTLGAVGVAADSSQAGLKIGVEVPHRCVVDTGATVQVRCARMPGTQAQPAVVSSAPAPQRVTRPAATSPSSASSMQTVTILF